MNDKGAEMIRLTRSKFHPPLVKCPQLKSQFSSFQREERYFNIIAKLLQVVLPCIVLAFNHRL